MNQQPRAIRLYCQGAELPFYLTHPDREQVKEEVIDAHYGLFLKRTDLANWDEEVMEQFVMFLEDGYGYQVIDMGDWGMPDNILYRMFQAWNRRHT